MRFIFPFAILATALLALPASAQLGDLARPLTSAERARLNQGEIVVRPTTERRGPLNLFGGVSYMKVDLPVASVWRALNDESIYFRRMLPQVERAVEQERHEDRSRVVRFEHEVGPITAAYSVRFEYNASAKTVIFRLDESRPHDIRAAWGFFRVRRSGDGTLVSFGCMVDAGDGLISDSLQDTLHEWVLKIPWTFSRFVEGSGRRRYTRGN